MGRVRSIPMPARKLVALAALTLAAAPESAAERVVLESPEQVVEVSCQLRITTTLVLPEGDVIADLISGDSENWQLQIADGTNLAFVKPSIAGSRTNLTLVTRAGLLYYFLVTESADAAPDLHVYVERPGETGDPDDPEAAAVPGGALRKPRFISRDEVEAYALAAEEATQRAVEASLAAEEQVNAAVDSFRSTYPTLMRFEYALEPSAAKDPFRILAMWHDGRFTYARSLAEEAPALYEHRDGKPSLVGYELTPGGLYIVQRVLHDGWFQVGKKRATWKRLVERLPPVGPVEAPSDPDPALAALPAAP